MRRVHRQSIRPMKKLILASTSIYRKQQLELLGKPFEAIKPLVDEDSLKDPKLMPVALAEKLAFAKAASLTSVYPDAIIIGGDQLVSFQNQILGKPKTFEKAFSQIEAMSGNTHELITSIAVLSSDKNICFTNITRMHMRKLSSEQIKAYIEIDQPLDCAGGYKIEKSGITLFEKIETSDFTAIQGLPLIELTTSLNQLGLIIP